MRFRVVEDFILRFRSLHDMAYEGEEFVGHVAEGHVQPFGADKYGALMTEGQETLLAMISTHA